MQNFDPAIDDLSAVQADDRLMDLLGSGMPSAAVELDDLGALLRDWRNEIESCGFGDLVDVDTAVAAIANATGPNWSPGALVRAATIALLIVAAFVGFVLTVRGL